MASGLGAWKKYLMTVWAVLECVLFGGLVYGWVSLVYVLKKEGIYADLCVYGGQNSSIVSLTPDNVTSGGMVSCPEQDEKLQLVFTVAVALMTFSAPVMGHIQYVCGTRVVRLMSTCFFLCGSLMTAFISPSAPWLIFIALPCVAIGGLSVSVNNIQVANMFVVGGSTVVCLMSASFDISATVLVVVKVAYEHGISRQISYLFLSALHTMVIFSTFVLLPKTFIPKVDAEKPDSDVVVCNGSGVANGSEGNRMDYTSPRPTRRDVTPRLRDCALSWIFLSHVGWFSLLQLRLYHFLGTLNTWLNYVTNEDDILVSHYTNVSLYIQLGGIFFTMFCGLIYDVERKRHASKPSVTERHLLPAVFPLTLTSLFAVLLSGLVLVPSIEVLYADFVVFTIFRSFLNGMAAAYIQRAFPADYFGSLFGVLLIVGGVVGSLQYPLFIWFESPPKGSKKVDIFLLALSLSTLIHPIYIWLTCRAAGKTRAAGNDNTTESEYAFIRKTKKCC